MKSKNTIINKAKIKIHLTSKKRYNIIFVMLYQLHVVLIPHKSQTNKLLNFVYSQQISLIILNVQYII